jgi:hypothetical protein
MLGVTFDEAGGCEGVGFRGGEEWGKRGESYGGEREESGDE